MVLETRKRREHLSKDDVQKNKALLENFATGNAQYLEEQQNGIDGTRKESLSKPPKRGIDWSSYLESPPGEPPLLGREQKCKESKKTFRATVAMSEEFPLTIDMLLSVLEVMNFWLDRKSDLNYGCFFSRLLLLNSSIFKS